MPLVEIAGELAGGIFRMLWHFVVEVFFQYAVKLPGYLILKKVFKSDAQIDSWRAGFTGLIFWLAIVYIAYFI